MDIYQLISLNVGVLLLLFVIPIQCKYHDRKHSTRDHGTSDDRNKLKLLAVFNSDKDTAQFDEDSDDGEGEDFSARSESRLTGYRAKVNSRSGNPISHALSLPSEAEVLLIDPRKILDKIARNQGNSRGNNREKAFFSSKYPEKEEKEDYEEYEGSTEDEEYSRDKSKEHTDGMEYPQIVVKSGLSSILGERVGRPSKSDNEDSNEEPKETRSKSKKDKKVVLLLMGYQK
ncbi:uncharacterized protein LOC141858530 [Brevipalpus obovatus]|uniref:uncharacterized protein LOC141858530 n=1 Tax=Brevipalpus obovatus TaxID=246614 RepID=UPI003D9EB501